MTGPSRADDGLFLAELAREAAARPAGSFPWGQDLKGPGLYSWWADTAGCALLSAPFGTPLGSLIYAGQAGATTPSGTERRRGLAERIKTCHLNGNIKSSTFRLTLAAVLRTALGLQMASSGRLEPESNQLLSQWMVTHLSLTCMVVRNRGNLATAEEELLRSLDPPFNLSGVPSSAVRTRLREIRKELLTAMG